MKHFFGLVLAGACTALPLASSAAPRHSLQEYASLIGAWSCTATLPESPSKSVHYTTTYAWMFPAHTAIEQRFVTQAGKAVDARFILTYSAPTDDFRGIYIESGKTNAAIGTWINPGPRPGGWTEHGYDLNRNGYPETSTSTFSRVTRTHYAITDYDSGPGKSKRVSQTEECTKQ